MNQPKNHEIKQFYKELQSELTDDRDNRGKVHELAFVITLMFYTIIRSDGKLSLSKLSRIMTYHHDEIKKQLRADSKSCISYSQLRRILMNLDYSEYNAISKKYFTKEVSYQELMWEAIDGKELRGSIDTESGKKRGENIILKIPHKTGSCKVLDFYSGDKESEKTHVYSYFQDQDDLSGKAFTLDALHNSERLLTLIAQKGGVYLTQIKENQEILLEDIKDCFEVDTQSNFIETTDLEHGRLEVRKAKIIPCQIQCLDHRWQNTQVKTFIYMQRTVTKTKTNECSVNHSYYISNLEYSKENELTLFNAIRNHWRVEVHNNTRDTCFGEDEIKSFTKNIQRSFASILTSCVNWIQNKKENISFSEYRERCVYLNI